MTANKYKADCLAEQALGRLKHFLRDEAQYNENRSLFIYAIPKLYQHQAVAPFMRWCISESKRFREDRMKKDKAANEEGEDETMREVGDSDDEDEEVVEIRNGTEAIVISDNEDDDSTKAQADQPESTGTGKKLEDHSPQPPLDIFRTIFVNATIGYHYIQ